MSSFVIQGPSQLSGTVPVYGSKNAALPLMAACLLTDEPIMLHNIPPIADVRTMADILTDSGVEVTLRDDRVRLAASSFDAAKILPQKVRLLRGSILLLGAMLGRDRVARLPHPGGDIIGSRPIDVHLDGFRQLGARITEEYDHVMIDGRDLTPGTVVLQQFSVTATENIMLAAARLPGVTTIHVAAAEPHVAALAELLQHMGVSITGTGTHTIVIEGNEQLKSAEYTNIPDMLEAGFFILLAAATQSPLTIEHVPTGDLLLFFRKLDDIGIAYDITPAAGPQTSAVTVKPGGQLRPFRMQSLPHPGIATDLQAPFAVIATQADGSSLIHDPLYEDRFRHITELQKMGAQAVICDPHRVIITGPTQLTGHEITSPDIRAGATLVMAALIAQGQTTIHQAEIVDRGYARLDERLRAIGARIERT